MPIDTARQQTILLTITKQATTAQRWGAKPRYNSKAAHLMMVGALIALGEEAPPHWIINVDCGRIDRLLPFNVAPFYVSKKVVQQLRAETRRARKQAQ